MKYFILASMLILLSACSVRGDDAPCSPINTTCYKTEDLIIIGINPDSQTVRVVDEWGSEAGTFRVNNPEFWDCNVKCYSLGDTATFKVKYRFFNGSLNTREGIKYGSN